MVNGRRVALLAGVMVALYALVLEAGWHVPDRLVGLLGGATGVERTGGVTATFRSTLDGHTFVVDVKGGSESVAHQLDYMTSGGISFHEVKNGEAFARAFPALKAERGDMPPEIGWDAEGWYDETQGLQRRAFMLYGPTSEALHRAIDGAVKRGLLDATQSRFGYVSIADESWRDPRKPPWFVYELDPKPELDASMIDNASASYDPNTNRPLVLVDFDAIGATTLHDVTKRLLGHKLAIALGSRVLSAPIIQAAIRGGRVAINIAGGNADKAERDSQVLAGELKGGAYPPSVLESEVPHDAHSTVTQELLARLLVALALGLVAAMATFGLVAITKPRWRTTPARIDGPFPWKRLAVTLSGFVAIGVLVWLDMPFINNVEFAHILHAGGRGHADPTRISFVMLGVAPILTAFGVVELVALAVPGLRWRRHDPVGRVALGKATAALAIVFALIQAWFVAGYLESLSLGGAEIVTNPGLKFRLEFTLELATVTMLLSVLAGMIREHGLGNGYAVVLVSTAIIGVFPRELADLFWLNQHLIAAVTMMVIAIVTVTVLRWRIASDGRPDLRVPSSGMQVLSPMGGIGYVIAVITAFGLGYTFDDVIYLIGDLGRSNLVIYGSFVVFVPLWSWILSRPSLVADVAARAKLAPPTRAMWLRATLVSLVLFVVCSVAGHVAVLADRDALQLMGSALAVMVGTATLLDIVDDARAWRRTLEPAAMIHQIQYLGAVEHVLADADIPCHVHASNLRTLLAFFGPWAPAIVLVPVEHADTARARLGDVLPVKWIR